MLHREYYNNLHEVDDNNETEEDKILREHPMCSKEDYEVFKELEQFLEDRHNEHMAEELGAFFGEHSDERAEFISDTGLPQELQNTATLNMIHMPEVEIPPFNNLPRFRDMDSYYASLNDVTIIRPEDNDGTSRFLQWGVAKEVKIQRLGGCNDPTPFVDTSGLAGGPDPSHLQPFPDISAISQALRLDINQHHAFDEIARHLKHKYSGDIMTASSEYGGIENSSSNLKPQLIAFLGGEAGTGKSAVIAALLTFATLWGRRNTIETMAFMGLAGLNVDGDTIHSHRGIDIFYNYVISQRIRENVSCVYLTIIDEISMAAQALIGLACRITREIVGKRDTPWGGIHVCLAGDWLQLPPISGKMMFEPTSDSNSKQNAEAAAALWKACNFRVILQEVRSM